MGVGEESIPSKSSKPASSGQEAPVTPTTPAYPDWPTSMQAFYGAGAAPQFFASTVVSPHHHPYMWGGQHPLVPPYGTPVPYPAMYPPGGMYALPNTAMTPGAPHGTAEVDGKDHSSNKKTNGASANHDMNGKTGEGGKTASGSGNDGGTRSGESGSDGSSDASDENSNQDFSAAKKGSFDQMLPDGSAPATNLNIGMDLWNTTPAGSGPMKLQPTSIGVSQAVVPSGMMNGQWTQDERELKRQKRKQSNRESARRSRLRKQAECEELQHKVEILSNENRSLGDELQRLSEECEKLTSENNSIKEELSRSLGPDAVTNLENGNSDTHESRGEEGKC